MSRGSATRRGAGGFRQALLIGGIVLSTLLPGGALAQAEGGRPIPETASELGDAPQAAEILTAGQLAALEARIASFTSAMRANDMAAVLGVVPPAVLERIAADFNITVEQLSEAAQQQMDALLEDTKIDSFGMDLATAEFATLGDGTPYALIPTETVIDMGESLGKMRSVTTTLGLLDGEVWYLVRTEDAPQVQILKDVYPGFAGVKFKPGTMEFVPE